MKKRLRRDAPNRSLISEGASCVETCFKCSVAAAAASQIISQLLILFIAAVNVYQAATFTCSNLQNPKIHQHDASDFDMDVFLEFSEI